MGYSVKNGSHCEKWVTFGKIAYTLKNGSVSIIIELRLATLRATGATLLTLVMTRLFRAVCLLLLLLFFFKSVNIEKVTNDVTQKSRAESNLFCCFRL